jgi:arylformamidase
MSHGAFDDDAQRRDEQFRLDRIQDLEGVMRRREAAARQALAQGPCERAIRYAAAPGCTLNLFRPAAPGPAPTLMFIHGGFWRSLDADLFSFVAPGFVSAGAAVAVIDYPLIPSVRLGDIVDACFDAVSFLHREAPALGLEASRLVVCGNSAGGHLVAELLDEARQRERGLPAQVLAGGCAISGLFDLEPVRQSFQNDALALTPDEVERYSALRRSYRPAAPLIATVGGQETEEFLGQNRRFAEVCRRSGVATQHREEPGMDHITVVLDALARPQHGLHQAVRDLLGLARKTGR